jgi:hypothetical protein
MPSAARQYTNELKRELGFLAAWPPGARIALGDIGTINEDNVFVRASSLESFGILFRETSASEGIQTFQFASAGAVEIGVKLAGQTSPLVPNVPQASAGLGIRFTREYATAFRAEGVRQTRIDDQVTLAREVLALMRDKRWDRDWSVVTDVVHAKATTALVGHSAGSGAEFEVSGAAQGAGLELLSAEAGLRTVASRDMQLMIVGTKGTTPLFRAMRVKRKWFIGRRELRAAYSDELETLTTADEDLDDVIFEETPIYNGVSESPDAPPIPGGAGASGR